LLFGTWECRSSEAASQPLENLQWYCTVPNTVTRS
jgi:hypothetical protein